jgi:lysophospholipase L1-like esterase
MIIIMANSKNKIKKEDADYKYKTSKSVLILVLVLILFVFQEILFRIIFPVPEITNFNRINYSPVFFSSSSSELKYLSNASFIWASDPDGTESLIKLNLYGFRSCNFKAEPDPKIPRIVFIGDSFVEGYLAKNDETIPSIFAKEAKTHRMKIESINLGIGGTDFSDYCKLLRDVVPVLNPDHVIIVLHANDLPPQPYQQEWFAKPLAPEHSYWWVPRLYYVVKNLIQGKTVPHRWISKPFIFFASVPAPSNPWSNDMKADEYEKFVSPKIATAMKKGRFNPFAVDEYALFKEHLPERFKITEHLNGIENFMAQYNKKIYIVYVPCRNQVSNYYLPYQKEFSSDSVLVPLTDSIYQVHAQIMKSSCGSLGIPFLDCTEIIKTDENSGHHLYWNYDEHMKPKGYALVGKAIYSWWRTVKND